MKQFIPSLIYLYIFQTYLLLTRTDIEQVANQYKKNLAVSKI